MKNQNPFEDLDCLISGFKDSDKPENRLTYQNSIKKMIEIGESLIRLKPDKETEKTIKMLKELIKNYKIYPKL